MVDIFYVDDSHDSHITKVSASVLDEWFSNRKLLMKAIGFHTMINTNLKTGNKSLAVWSKDNDSMKVDVLFYSCTI